ncbi:hypothetical protein EVAR_9344_1 [Eumeta japonica]|uniref:Uncharacterized protein n=1 Tax=Eumeta variegata TaxID=151549 RepID=A0A4C1YVG2_EUMVA|nr:hypothetical protein EVAR_9344_1 [Eumeta japonica]
MYIYARVHIEVNKILASLQRCRNKITYRRHLTAVSGRRCRMIADLPHAHTPNPNVKFGVRILTAVNPIALVLSELETVEGRCDDDSGTYDLTCRLRGLE